MTRVRWYSSALLSLLLFFVIHYNSTGETPPATPFPTEATITLPPATWSPTATLPATVTMTPTPAATPSPSITPTVFPSLTTTATPPATPTSTATAVPTLTPTITPTPSPTSLCRPATDNVSAFPVPAGPWPRPAAANQVIGRGNGGSNLMALTVDVEGTGPIISGLLDVFDKHGVKVTVFLLGNWAEANSAWVAEIARRGHEFGNHGYSHANMRQISAVEIQDELRRTEELVQSLTGQTTKPWMRPPFGAYDEATVQAAYEAGWTTIMWSSTGRDTDADATETTICNTLVQYAAPGSILLIHPSRPGVVTAVDRFLTEMIARGYSFVPLSVLLAN